MPGSSTVQLTGKLGEVIKESAHIALSFLKSHAFNLGLTTEMDKDLMEKRSIHLHMPEGAIGKEGPSAGTAILTGILSLFVGKGIRSDLGQFSSSYHSKSLSETIDFDRWGYDLAMTGEMTLAGQVLPVGGLKEKILAAHRAGIKKIIAPAANRPDIEHNVSRFIQTHQLRHVDRYGMDHFRRSHRRSKKESI
jgi:ATP-dependent Lon protease